MTNSENIALANNIALVKNYVDDPNNLYQVLRAGLKTSGLETRFVEFIGASTMSYPLFPLDDTDLPNYSKTEGYERTNATLERKEVTVSQDKGYQMAIDALDLEDSHTTAIAYINNQVRQKEVPSVDKYRLNALATASGVTTISTVDLSSQDALELYDDAAKSLIDNEIPIEGTILYCTTSFYNKLKQSDRIRRSITADTSNNGSIDRTVTMLDDVTEIVIVPSKRMPANTEFILVQPLAVIAGIKRSKTSIKDEPEDFDGVLINRRLVHDCFVLEGRAKGVYVGKTAA